MLADSAFYFLIKKQGRQVTIKDLNTGNTSTTYAARANKWKVDDSIEEIGINTTRFMISAAGMDTQTPSVPKRGYRIIDSELGTFMIESIEPLWILGKLVGWRVETQ